VFVEHYLVYINNAVEYSHCGLAENTLQLCTRNSTAFQKR